MSDNSNQKQIYQMANRGGLADDSFTARQIAMAILALVKLAESIDVAGGELASLVSTGSLERLVNDDGYWQTSVITRPTFVHEFGSAVVPLFRAAEAQDVNLAQLALEVAEIEAKRGPKRRI